MIRRFVIGVDALTPEQEQVFREYLSSKGTWWHWISNMWLFVTSDSDISVSSINEKIGQINPKARSLIMETQDDISWSTRAVPNKKGKKISDWLMNQWVTGE